MTLNRSCSHGLMRQWKWSQKEVSLAKNKEGKHRLAVTEGNKTTWIPSHQISGIPPELKNDEAGLGFFLSTSFVKPVRLENGEHRIEVTGKLVGGANIIHPFREYTKLWPRAVVPYEISLDDYPISSPQRKMIQEAIGVWNNANTGFCFIPRTHVAQKHYLAFGSVSGACRSQVKQIIGWDHENSNSPQYIRCDLHSRGFNTASIIHEIAHAIGFYHEHQRTDRDQHVQVLYLQGNGSKRQRKQYEIDFGIQGTPHGMYDFNSIMHHPFWWDKNIVFFPFPQYAHYLIMTGYNTIKLSEGDKNAARFLAKYAKLRTEQIAQVTRSSSCGVQTASGSHSLISHPSFPDEQIKREFISLCYQLKYQEAINFYHKNKDKFTLIFYVFYLGISSVFDYEKTNEKIYLEISCGFFYEVVQGIMGNYDKFYNLEVFDKYDIDMYMISIYYLIRKNIYIY